MATILASSHGYVNPLINRDWKETFFSETTWQNFLSRIEKSSKSKFFNEMMLKIPLENSLSHYERAKFLITDMKKRVKKLRKGEDLYQEYLKFPLNAEMFLALQGTLIYLEQEKSKRLSNKAISILSTLSKWFGNGLCFSLSIGSIFLTRKITTSFIPICFPYELLFSLGSLTGSLFPLPKSLVKEIAFGSATVIGSGILLTSKSMKDLESRTTCHPAASILLHISSFYLLGRVPKIIISKGLERLIEKMFAKNPIISKERVFSLIFKQEV